ncbi:helix-turn-helix transcriptional regulator [Umezawaea sp. Da 62-37]|uniref:helix-turn-helix domain-containing protein n=1 Tax=Umezawaea sp. Da 62-37 TaxID=3075927 RepID=UPI0028F73413|nr:helix-turn-helix transcriptional regulator [Umezawaea sp. Da 62-37]WNV82702.1 helix-turn-helix transcriptional regulator [Umezawaea sp. Da 62-37]
MPHDRPSPALAHRLRALRAESWPGVAITQKQLATAFGASSPLLSSWEAGKVPPPARLAAYATFFATRRSIEAEPYRVPDPSELTAEENAVREHLIGELAELADSGTPGRGFWYFPDRYDITIVVAQLTEEQMPLTPYTDPASPDHVELYTYADLDSLIELHGHIRSVNPDSQVHFRTATSLSPDDYTTHLVLLGGVDWNVVTTDVVDRVDLPVNQAERPDVSDAGGFEVIEDGRSRVVEPLVVRGKLIQDVAQFYRGVNPYNRKRTVTICNGQYGRGTLGAVRALTDSKFRDRNEAYLRSRFAGHDAYSVITRVTIVNGQVVTPDWTSPENVLFEWPEGQG